MSPQINCHLPSVPNCPIPKQIGKSFAHPIEVKSGKDYTEHSALNNLLKVSEYNVLAATVISNERKVYQDGKVTYMPVYFVMFMEADTPQADESEFIF